MSFVSLSRHFPKRCTIDATIYCGILPCSQNFTKLDWFSKYRVNFVFHENRLEINKFPKYISSLLRPVRPKVYDYVSIILWFGKEKLLPSQFIDKIKKDKYDTKKLL